MNFSYDEDVGCWNAQGLITYWLSHFLPVMKR